MKPYNTLLKSNSSLNMMVWGVGAFTHGVLKVIKEDGTNVCTYLIRDYAHYSPSLEEKNFSFGSLSQSLSDYQGTQN